MKQLFKIKSVSALSIVLLAIFFLSVAYPVSAICEGPIVPCGGSQCAEEDAEGKCIEYEKQPSCQFCHIFVLIERIIFFVFTCLVPIVASLMLIIGGSYLLIAGPSPQALHQARAILTAAVIGIVIIFIAWLFLSQLLTAMGYAEWTGLGSWWDFTEKCPIR